MAKDKRQWYTRVIESCVTVDQLQNALNIFDKVCRYVSEEDVVHLWKFARQKFWSMNYLVPPPTSKYSSRYRIKISDYHKSLKSSYKY